MKIRILLTNYLKKEENDLYFWQLVFIPTLTLAQHKWEYSEELYSEKYNSFTVTFEWLFWAMTIQFYESKGYSTETA